MHANESKGLFVQEPCEIQNWMHDLSLLTNKRWKFSIYWAAMPTLCAYMHHIVYIVRVSIINLLVTFTCYSSQRCCHPLSVSFLSFLLFQTEQKVEFVTAIRGKIIMYSILWELFSTYPKYRKSNFSSHIVRLACGDDTTLRWEVTSNSMDETCFARSQASNKRKKKKLNHDEKLLQIIILRRIQMFAISVILIGIFDCFCSHARELYQFSSSYQNPAKWTKSTETWHRFKHISFS